MMASRSTGSASRQFLDLKGEWRPVLAAFFLILVGAAAYVSYTGLIAYMNDGFLLANRAKHVADEFNLNVNQVDGVPALNYPPLYSLVVAAAYLLDDPAAIFRVVLSIHVVLTASQVFPLFLLLRQYGRVAAWPASGLATALALSPVTLPYTSMYLTEVLYCPVLLWLIYFLHRTWIANDRVGQLGAGALVAAAMMTRSAGSVLLLALLLTGCVLVWMRRSGGELSGPRRRGLVVAAVAFVAVYGTWSLVELVFVHYEAHSPQFTSGEVQSVFTDVNRLDLHASWFANCIYYLTTASLSMAGLFPFILFLRRPGLVKRDPMALFFFVTMFIAAAVISLVTADHWGGRELVWNRYVMPYVVFTMLMAVRYRDQFNYSLFFSCVLVLGMGLLSFRPSSLAPHFVDSFAAIELHRPHRYADVLYNLGFFGVAVAAGWLWLKPVRGRRIAVGLTAIIWLATHATAAFRHRHSGDLNISAYQGLAHRAYEAARASGMPVYWDPAFGINNTAIAARILFYWPDLEARKLPLAELPTLDIPAGKSILYLSAKAIGGLEPIGTEQGLIHLYKISNEQIAAWRTTRGGPATSTSIRPGKNFPGGEEITKDSKKVTVRWLNSGVEFYVEPQSGIEELIIRMTLATHAGPRTASLMVNGEKLRETYLVQGNYWSSPAAVVEFRTRVNEGSNLCQLLAKEKTAKLADGREVAFLLVGDIEAFRPPGSRPK